MAKKSNYIISITNSDGDGAEVYRVTGTVTQVKKHLLQLVKNDWDERWDYGTEKVRDVEERNDGSLYAYSVFGDYHIDYLATLETESIVLG